MFFFHSPLVVLINDFFNRLVSNIQLTHQLIGFVFNAVGTVQNDFMITG